VPWWPRVSSPPVKASGLWARHAPVQTAPRLGPTSSSHSPLCRATTGWWRSSIPPGALRSAVGWRSGATGPWWRRPDTEVGSDGPSGALQPLRLSATLPPNTAPGSTKWHGGFGSERGVFSSVALSMRPTMLTPAGLTLWRSPTPITPIRIVGRRRDNPWCEQPRAVALVVSNVMVGRGLAHGPNALNVSFIRPGHTRGPPHNWQRTYETDI